MFGWIGILVAVFLILVGGYLVIFFPGMPEHQPPQMTIGAIIMGFLMIVVGVLMIVF